MRVQRMSGLCGKTAAEPGQALGKEGALETRARAAGPLGFHAGGSPAILLPRPDIFGTLMFVYQRK